MAIWDSPYRSPVRSMGDDESTDDDVDYYAYWKNGSRPNSPTQDGSLGNNKKRRHFSPGLYRKIQIQKYNYLCLITNIQNNII